ncbi:MAG: TatD family hydrolase, partial [Bacteroidota bacterium]
MIFTDTHTHLYLDEFDEDREAVIADAIGRGVTRMFLPNIDSGSIPGMMEIVNRYPENCF